MEQGWIKLHRKVLDNPIATRAEYAWLWMTLLLMANHRNQKVMWNNDVVVIKEGQFITGRKKLSQQTGIKETTIERILKYLENGHQIEQQKTNKYRVITIINWRSYQDENIRTDNKRTTDGQQTDTNKNEENEKNSLSKDKEQVFNLKEEIKKLEESPKRELNIIAFLLEKRKPTLENRQQFVATIKRHIRAANQLKAFTDQQLITAHNKASIEYPEWTLETLLKVLTK